LPASEFIVTIYNRKRCDKVFPFGFGCYMENSVSTFRSMSRRQGESSRVPFIFCLLITGLFYLTAVSNTVSAATYYLDDANGDNSNPGTSSAPWRTLDRAYTWYSGADPKVQEGDTVYLRNGNYGTFADATSNRSNWITYKAESGHTPIFTNIALGRWDGPYNLYLKFEGIHVVGGPNPGVALNKCISVATCSYVQFLNMTIYGSEDYVHEDHSAGIYIREGVEITIQGCTIYNFSAPVHSHGAVGETSTDILIDSCTLYDGTWGILAYGARWTITNNDISQIYDGMQVVCTDTTIEGNIIHNFWPNDEFHADGIQLFPAPAYPLACDNVAVRRNTISGTHDHSISARGTDASDVVTNLIIENNLCYEAAATDLQLIWVDGSIIYNNTFITYLTDIRSNCSSLSISGNICKYLSICSDQEYSYASTVDYEEYNICWKWWTAAVDAIASDTTLDLDGNTAAYQNLFEDYDTNDFTLASGSTAIDFGNANYSPISDILGVSRVFPPDAGCYEYISSGSGNQAPVLAAIGNKSVNENSALSFSVSATDSDSNTITYSASGTAISAGADFNDQTLTFTWTPGYDQAGTYGVTFTASDGTASDSETITITVNNVNRGPELAFIGDKSVNENSALSFSISATDADGDDITYSVQSLPTGAVFVNQTFFAWTPSYSQAGAHQVSFTASDGTDSDSETITITVNNVNRAPILAAIGNKSIFTETSLSFTVSATDPDGDTITYSVENLPSGATFANRNFSWTPSDSQADSYEITFTASDGQTQVTETITITVTVDTSAPTVTNLSPVANSIQAPLNSLIYLDVTDTGRGVNASTVTIEVNSSLVYTGNTTDYHSSYGHCRRIGNSAAYTYVYQADEMFDYDQTVTVTVNATDLAANPMNEYSYSFKTEMRSFGANKKVNSSSNNSSEHSVTASDSSGNIWVVWHTGQVGSRDIYAGKLTAGADSFGNSVQITNDNADQCNPVIAIDGTDKLYVAWQDSRNGEWDIYLSTSVNGTNWSTERKITDPNSNQVNPAIVIDGSNRACIVWEDDRNNNKDIYIASSSDSFASKTTSQITSNASGQITPAIAVDSGNTVYVVWKDARGGTSDIYGADSDNGPWTNVAVVSNANNQSSPAVATEAAGSILHLLWVDDTPGNDDIFYVKTTGGLPGSPLTGSSIIDDSSGADQSAPVITITGSTGNDLKVFACWKDERNVSGGNGDMDLYFVEVNSGSGTNVFVGDSGTNSAQSYPVIAVDADEYPYLVWTDDRNTNTDIYYAGSSFVESSALESEDIVISSGAIVGTELTSINSATDVSVTVPAGASSHDVTITISRIRNPKRISLDYISSLYEFGPSGIEFDEPVTIIIPYDISTVGGSASAYWYNPLTDLLSQEGITDVEVIEISSTLRAVRFKTDHFTQYLIGGSGSVSGGGGGGGGGCSMSRNSQGSIAEFLLPYIGLAIVMVILKRRDARNQRACDITRSKC